LTGAVECVTGAAAAGAELDGERSLSLASSELSEVNPLGGISRMTGKEGGGLEDSVVVTVDRCFFFGRVPCSALQWLILTFDVMYRHQGRE
jgi:hypothetical protein